MVNDLPIRNYINSRKTVKQILDKWLFANFWEEGLSYGEVFLGFFGM
jgi:hypothetical protein